MWRPAVLHRGRRMDRTDPRPIYWQWVLVKGKHWVFSPNTIPFTNSNKHIFPPRVSIYSRWCCRKNLHPPLSTSYLHRACVRERGWIVFISSWYTLQLHCYLSGWWNWQKVPLWFMRLCEPDKRREKRIHPKGTATESNITDKIFKSNTQDTEKQK